MSIWDDREEHDGTAVSGGSAMKLTGDRCQCTACGEYFNSTYAFDRHRVRYVCRTAEELRAKGWSVNAAGFWITSKMPDSSVREKQISGPNEN